MSGGEFVSLEEDREEYIDFVLLGVSAVGTGEFLCLEEDREEFVDFTLLGVIPSPRPRGRVRKRRYIDGQTSKNIVGVNVLNSYFVEKPVEVLNPSKEYRKEQDCELMNVTMRKSLVCSTKGLAIHKFYKLYMHELIVEGINFNILKTIEFPIEKVVLLSFFSSELNIIIPDLAKSSLKRMMRYLEYLDRIKESKD